MTTSTTTYSAGDVVQVKFPFTDLRRQKVRPGVVVCSDAYISRHHDVVLIALTSQVQTAGLNLTRWRDAGLPRETWVKPLLMTLTSEAVVKKIGALHADDNDAVRAAIHSIIVSSYR